MEPRENEHLGDTKEDTFCIDTKTFRLNWSDFKQITYNSCKAQLELIHHNPKLINPLKNKEKKIWNLEHKTIQLHNSKTEFTQNSQL